jgi:hypothetical protein
MHAGWTCNAVTRLCRYFAVPQCRHDACGPIATGTSRVLLKDAIKVSATRLRRWSI